MRNCPVCEQSIAEGVAQCPHCGSVFSAPLESTATDMNVMGPMGSGGASIVAGGPVDPFDMKANASMAEFADIPFENAAEVTAGIHTDADKPGRWAVTGRVIFIVILAGLILTALYFGLSSLNVIRATTNRLPAATQMPTSEPALARQTVDDEEGYLLTLYGGDGDRIYIKPLNRTLTVENGVAEIFLPFSTFIPDEPLGAVDELNVDLELMLYPVTGGAEEPINLPAFSVPVPKTQLEIIKPDVDNLDSMSTSRSEMEIALTTSSEARLSVNGMEVSIPPVDRAAGLYKFPLSLNEIGENVFVISSWQPGHSTSERTLVISRNSQLVQLSLDAGVAERVSGLILKISGITEPDAEISCSYEMQNLNMDTATGSFTADVLLPEYGLQEFDITASNQAGETHWMHKVYAYPDMEEYTRSAWALDYADAYKSPSKFAGRAFAFSGQIARIDGNERVTITLNVDSDPDKPVNLVYEGGAELHVGRIYKVFADSAGAAEFGIPSFLVRFIFEQSEPVSEQ